MEKGEAVTVRGLGREREGDGEKENAALCIFAIQRESERWRVRR